MQRELCFKICYKVNTEVESILCKHIFLVVINLIYDTFLGTLLCSVVIGEREAEGCAPSALMGWIMIDSQLL